MLKVEKMLKSETGALIASLVLGLGIAGLFKMSCDSRSCIIYKGPDFSEKKIVKVNGKCYNVSEEMMDCANAKSKPILL
jgi:hypothetical protein|tara:strand:+ start:328 stop:564 length:237 start_codon:yes stop_codon:yes gene_type:complete